MPLNEYFISDRPRNMERTVNKSLEDGTHLYETEYRAYHLEREGFRIAELQLSPSQSVPWHKHTEIGDTFYILSGSMRLFLKNPKDEVRLKPGQSHLVEANRPHLVTNEGTTSLRFLIMQGVGTYDYVPLV